MAFERIWAEDTTGATTKALELDGTAYEGAYVYDQNEWQRDHQEDVLGVLEVEGAVLIVLADGISKSSEDESSLQNGFKSLPVARQFTEQAFAHAKPFMRVRSPFSIARMHQSAADFINHSYLSGDLDKGGLVVVSALFLPDGHLQAHRIGDPQPLLSRSNPKSLIVPTEWTPENVAHREYLTWCQNKGLTPDLERDTEWAKRVFVSTQREDQKLTRYIVNYQPFELGKDEEDFKTTLTPKEGVLLASDGLKTYDNRDRLAEKIDCIKDPPATILHKLHLNALVSSGDNMTGVFLRRKAT